MPPQPPQLPFHCCNSWRWPHWLFLEGRQAGRLLEKDERELLRWKRNKTGRRKKKRESPMNIFKKIQARASVVVVVAG